MPTVPRTVTLQEAALQLGLHYMTVYRYVRTGKLPATQDGMIWRVKTSDVASLEQRRRGYVRLSGLAPAERPPPSKRLKARLVAGDSAGAWWLVEGRLGGGLDPSGVDHHALVAGPSLHRSTAGPAAN